MKIFIATLLLTVVSASLDIRAQADVAASCRRVSRRCTGAQRASARSYCASTVTKTYTTTSTTTTTVISTRTTSTISTSTSSSTTTVSTSTASTTVTTLPTCTAPGILKQRSLERRRVSPEPVAVIQMNKLEERAAIEELVALAERGTRSPASPPTCLGPNVPGACSCLGVSAKTTTRTATATATATSIKVSTVTVTSTSFSISTITTTATITSTGTAFGPFSISGSTVVSSSSAAAVITTSLPNFAAAQSSTGYDFVGFEEIGDLWYLNPDGTLLDFTETNLLAFEYTDATGNEPVLLATAETIASSGGYQPLICSIDDATCKLDCIVNGNENNFQCYDVSEWYISPNENGGSKQCNPFQPMVIF